MRFIGNNKILFDEVKNNQTNSLKETAKKWKYENLSNSYLFLK